MRTELVPNNPSFLVTLMEKYKDKIMSKDNLSASDTYITKSEPLSYFYPKLSIFYNIFP